MLNTMTPIDNRSIQDERGQPICTVICLCGKFILQHIEQLGDAVEERLPGLREPVMVRRHPMRNPLPRRIESHKRHLRIGRIRAFQRAFEVEVDMVVRDLGKREHHLHRTVGLRDMQDLRGAFLRNPETDDQEEHRGERARARSRTVCSCARYTKALSRMTNSTSVPKREVL